MYPVSNAFHTAVRNRQPQRVLLIFSDMVFTNEDINVENGIEFHDNFNMEENLAIGQATSNEITFSLFNDDRLLNDYTFGDFTATCGVRLGTDTYSGNETARVVVGDNVYTCHATAPYVRMNGTGLATQPGGKIISVMWIDGKLTCFGALWENCIVYSTADNSVLQEQPHVYMKRRAQKYWNGLGVFYNSNTRMYYEWRNGVRSQYEFCPFGTFTAERPKAPDTLQINMDCYDYMQKFEKDMPSAADLGVTYPLSVSGLLNALCLYAGVSCATGSFINSTATITKEPEEFKNATMRDVLKWIAEAAGSNARFNRDGELELAWLKTTDQEYSGTDYIEFNPCWYETKQITKLYNRDTQRGEDKTYGSGDEGYLIQDNPILKGVS